MKIPGSGAGQPPCALITGIAGQDGAYLAQLLLSKGYRVVGLVRPRSDTWRLSRLEILDRVELIPFVRWELEDFNGLLSRVKPDELYHLAAQSSVDVSLREPLASGERDSLYMMRLLEAVRLSPSGCKIFYACSSEVFGPDAPPPQDESTPLNPRNPYACAKAYGHSLLRTYRETFGVFACTGFLFNHESPLRGENFVTRKIACGFARLSAQQGPPIQLGSLDSRRDWGFAPEYVDAMWRMLQAREAEDFVLSTGVTHSVRDFCEFCATSCGIHLEWITTDDHELGREISTGRVFVEASYQRHRFQDSKSLVGNPAKALAKLNWRALTRAPQLAALMVKTELKTQMVS